MAAGSKDTKVAAEVIVSGRVQGVGYRFFTERIAPRHGIKGWSMNMPDGRVMLDIEGEREDALLFIEELEKGPGMAIVTKVDVTWKPCMGKYDRFFIKI